MLSSMINPDVIENLDSAKTLAYDAKGEPVMCSRPGPRFEYWEAED
jgi:hypothetical protein